jgi:hypothetical protein
MERNVYKLCHSTQSIHANTILPKQKEGKFIVNEIRAKVRQVFLCSETVNENSSLGLPIFFLLSFLGLSNKFEQTFAL